MTRIHVAQIMGGRVEYGYRVLGSNKGCEARAQNFAEAEEHASDMQKWLRPAVMSGRGYLHKPNQTVIPASIGRFWLYRRKRNMKIVRVC